MKSSLLRLMINDVRKS